MRLTTPTRTVLLTLLEDPSRAHYGLEICEKTGLFSGTVYPVLARLEKYGWLESAWETTQEPDDGGAGLARPRRHYYRFTATGAAEARAELARRAQRGCGPWYVPEGGT
ncbi:hypothetical protein BLA24_18130 [Streptomyces cinnamoneus]|uniref:Transcription regulator PadR N-terminal domain-containing protein n=1 Tax=Streptomyces cinnamoneus TaxID=53446 RepID=A0A2G1XI39_STRCJ|nr:hypothetical protein BLA24_18130 [Streptomyces cinnamoneus]PPT16575.1 PadR family transcriptional regulator [Streptomyces cinnamoneus]